MVDPTPPVIIPEDPAGDGSTTHTDPTLGVCTDPTGTHRPEVILPTTSASETPVGASVLAGIITMTVQAWLNNAPASSTTVPTARTSGSGDPPLELPLSGQIELIEEGRRNRGEIKDSDGGEETGRKRNMGDRRNRDGRRHRHGRGDRRGGNIGVKGKRYEVVGEKKEKVAKKVEVAKEDASKEKGAKEEEALLQQNMDVTAPVIDGHGGPPPLLPPVAAGGGHGGPPPPPPGHVAGGHDPPPPPPPPVTPVVAGGHGGPPPPPPPVAGGLGGPQSPPVAGGGGGPPPQPLP
ncbi:PREDICTED: WW domain-binding protein 11-like [Amphimedon queenslandica]|uniref:Uncharacterized protein n=1 Tax=Amphimedon queenslandica TaxID=400682 RepID=A0AAN0J6W9_AMPQE|nr:PREDICTED: WW domain-binding protein 11-like [Amphimedon queenslandica]|eukprot:XP_019852476.1 PREDICTED: WW domain-binding protein 11-like [Amphimedon queenslandica]